MTTSLTQALQGAGYYPALAQHVIASALGDEEVRAHFVHAETTFDAVTVRRHMTVLVVTPTRLLRVHMDDGTGQEGAPHEAAATVDSVFLSRISTMAMTHVVHDPESFTVGQTPSELVLAVGWGTQSRIELEPASCGDEACEADHGYSGAIMADESLVRVSAIADGEETVKALESFARTLQGAIGAAA